MRNIKLFIEYDGTDFCGWQIQVEDRTVQAEVERSLSMLTGESVRITAAGRTDSGVHAKGQVAHFKTASQLPLDAFVKGGNSRLPADVRILGARDVASDFHARYSARRRSYQYIISPQPLAIGRQYAWMYWQRLDIDLLQQASTYLIGTHDFTSFCQVGSGVENYMCTVEQAAWSKDEHRLLFNITANRFIHNMVRIIVGTCVDVGAGTMEPQEMQRILQVRDRSAAGQTAPASGLCLVKVEYEDN